MASCINCGWTALQQLVIARDTRFDGLDGIEHHQVDDRQRGNERMLELRILERPGADEDELDSLVAKGRMRIKIDAAAQIDVRACANRAAQGEHLVLLPQAVIDLDVR